MNHDLLSHMRIPHMDCINNPLMVSKLECPRASIKVLSQSTHQCEGVQWYDHPAPVLSQNRVPGFFQKTNVKLLYALNHFPNVIGLNSFPQRDHG
jgi:hypothetical protein